MLSEGKIHPTLSVVDLDEAKKFYGDKLGLKQVGEEIEGHIIYEAGSGTMVTIYKRSDPPKAENTAAAFLVKDVAMEVKQLQEKGVKFEEYDFPGLKTINGIASIGEKKAAWFKDPAGNILAIGSLET
jgi:catechol 2,3-dioxygenase-like lactoylglutathione lyase family enzyme